MTVTKTEIEGVFVVEPKVFGDERGYFFESYNERDFAALTGMNVMFVQDNESRSSRGVVRGLHFQRPPHAQAKLVRTVVGTVLDVAVDIRRGSPTYGRHVAVELSADNHRQLFLPKGIAHGFAVLSDVALFQYKCDDFYHPETEGGIAWDDPQLAIDWHLPLTDVVLSAKDHTHPRLADFETPFTI